MKIKVKIFFLQIIDFDYFFVMNVIDQFEAFSGYVENGIGILTNRIKNLHLSRHYDAADHKQVYS